MASSLHTAPVTAKGGLVTQLGGLEAAARAMHAFGRQLAADGRLAPLFAGQDTPSMIAQQVRIWVWTRFICQDQGNYE